MNKKTATKLFVIIANPPMSQQERLPSWLIFLAYLAYLRAMRPQSSPEVGVLRILIVVVGLVLAILALVVHGTPEVIVDVLKYWPVIP